MDFADSKSDILRSPSNCTFKYNENSTYVHICNLDWSPLSVEGFFAGCHIGVFEPKYHKSADGFEMTWAVNVLAPFLLTSLLMDRVTERIVIVSSMSAGSHIDFDNLNQVNPLAVSQAFACLLPAGRQHPTVIRQAALMSTG